MAGRQRINIPIPKGRNRQVERGIVQNKTETQQGRREILKLKDCYSVHTMAKHGSPGTRWPHPVTLLAAGHTTVPRFKGGVMQVTENCPSCTFSHFWTLLRCCNLSAWFFSATSKVYYARMVFKFMFMWEVKWQKLLFFHFSDVTLCSQLKIFFCCIFLNNIVENIRQLA